MSIQDDMQNHGVIQPVWSGDRYNLDKPTIVEFGPVKKIGEINVPKAEDCSSSFGISLHEFDGLDFNEQSIWAGSMSIVEPFEVKAEIDPARLANIRMQIAGLPEEYYELWPEDHNVNDGFHFPDPWGDATDILHTLRRSLSPLTDPPCNHDKVSSKKADKFDLSECHFDSFEGMRLTEDGQRLPVWRHFINLSETTRTTVVGLHSPQLAAIHLPKDYRENMLDDFISACGHNIDMLVLFMPPARLTKRFYYGFRILTTHIFHGEYGEKNDLLAIVNSLG